MPPNYTNREFMQMREQAIVNAREMQRRAAIKDSSQAQPKENQEHSSSHSEFESNDDFEHNTLRFEKRPDAEAKSKQKPHHAPNRPRIMHQASHSDDRMLIMTLLLILIADGADKMLIFALMYIMM